MYDITLQPLSIHSN